MAGHHRPIRLAFASNRDRADITAFSRGSNCDTHVSLSTGSTFAAQTKWHDVFVCGSEIPGTGDFNGDNRDDVAAFTRGPACDVYLAFSNTSSFVNSAKWSDYFACGSEIAGGASTW